MRRLLSIAFFIALVTAACADSGGQAVDPPPDRSEPTIDASSGWHPVDLEGLGELSFSLTLAPHAGGVLVAGTRSEATGLRGFYAYSSDLEEWDVLSDVNIMFRPRGFVITAAPIALGHIGAFDRPAWSSSAQQVRSGSAYVPTNWQVGFLPVPEGYEPSPGGQDSGSVAGGLELDDGRVLAVGWIRRGPENRDTAATWVLNPATGQWLYQQDHEFEGRFAAVVDDAGVITAFGFGTGASAAEWMWTYNDGWVTQTVPGGHETPTAGTFSVIEAALAVSTGSRTDLVLAGWRSSSPGDPDVPALWVRVAGAWSEVPVHHLPGVGSDVSVRLTGFATHGDRLVVVGTEGNRPLMWGQDVPLSTWLRNLG